MHALLNPHPETRSRAFARVFSPTRGDALLIHATDPASYFPLFAVTRLGSVDSLRAWPETERTENGPQPPHGSGAKKEKSAEKERESLFPPLFSLFSPCRFARRSNPANDAACFCALFPTFVISPSRRWLKIRGLFFPIEECQIPKRKRLSLSLSVTWDGREKFVTLSLDFLLSRDLKCRPARRDFIAR